jgi:hypothetical protein
MFLPTTVTDVPAFLFTPVLHTRKVSSVSSSIGVAAKKARARFLLLHLCPLPSDCVFMLTSRVQSSVLLDEASPYMEHMKASVSEAGLHATGTKKDESKSRPHTKHSTVVRYASMFLVFVQYACVVVGLSIVVFVFSVDDPPVWSHRNQSGSRTPQRSGRLRSRNEPCCLRLHSRVLSRSPLWRW